MGTGAWIFVVSSVLVLGVAAMVFGPDIKRHYANKWLHEHGVAAPARVMALHDTGRRHNYNPQVRLELEVEPEGAEPFRAELTLVVSAVHLPRMQPGARLAVKYDPQRRTRVALAKP